MDGQMSGVGELPGGWINKLFGKWRDGKVYWWVN